MTAPAPRRLSVCAVLAAVLFAFLAGVAAHTLGAPMWAVVASTTVAAASAIVTGVHAKVRRVATGSVLPQGADDVLSVALDQIAAQESRVRAETTHLVTAPPPATAPPLTNDPTDVEDLPDFARPVSSAPTQTRPARVPTPVP